MKFINLLEHTYKYVHALSLSHTPQTPPPPQHNPHTTHSLQAMWDVQKKMPGIHLCGTVMFFPNEFLARKSDQIPKLIDRKPADTLAARRDFLARKDGSIAA